MKSIFKKKEEKEREDQYLNFDIYWRQEVTIDRVQNRLNFFIEKCQNKKVLHFGCTDWPIFNAENNLHIQLSNVTEELHGFDIDTEGIENLRKYVDDKYYSDFTDVLENEYDVCLIPETIEHVDNVQIFLENISKINAKVFLITGPNCFAPEHMSRNFNGDDRFIEIVHPDHNCWYSPYTLTNQIMKYSNLSVNKVSLLENERMVCCEANKK